MSTPGIPDYSELETLVQLAQEIDDRLDRYWRRLIFQFGGCVLLGALAVVSAFQQGIVSTTSTSSGIFSLLAANATIPVLIASAGLAMTLPRTSRQFVAEASAHAQVTTLARETYSLLEARSLSAVQRATIEVQLSRLRLPEQVEGSLVFALLPGARSRYRRTLEKVRGQRIFIRDEEAVSSRLLVKLREGLGKDRILAEPAFGGSTVDVLVRPGEDSGKNITYLVDVMHVQDSRHVRDRVVASADRLLNVETKLLGSSDGDDYIREFQLAREISMVVLCIVPDEKEYSIGTALREIRESQDGFRDGQIALRSMRVSDVYDGPSQGIANFVVGE